MDEGPSQPAVTASSAMQFSANVRWIDMPQLLVTTPSHVLRYCTDSRATFIIETDRHEYYGASWFRGDSSLYLSHSGLVDHNHVVSPEEYMLSEVGYLSSGDRTSEPFLSAPHQIRCIEDGIIAATNTGRNCLSLVNARDWSIRQIRLSEILWDRFGASDRSGKHYNSIEYKNGRLFLVAHNFDKGSFTVELEWPSLRLIEISQHQTSGIHNLWIRDDGVWLACDSMKNGLIDLKTGKTLWQTDTWSFTRGLAATTRDTYVGSSKIAPRELRGHSETGVWVIDAGTMKTRDYHWLGHFGGVHEVRLIDELDLCHAVGALSLSPDNSGVLASEYWRDKRLIAAQLRASFNEQWKIELGDAEPKSGGGLSLPGGTLNLATRRDQTIGSNLTIAARLSIKGRCEAHSAIVGGYLGPGDENMIAVLLAGTPKGQIGLELWVNSESQWRCVFGQAHPLLSANAKLILRADSIKMLLNECEIFSMVRPNAVRGRVGVRGINGQVSDFSVSPF
jgi:hypothetical protein